MTKTLFKTCYKISLSGNRNNYIDIWLTTRFANERFNLQNYFFSSIFRKDQLKAEDVWEE